MPATEHAQDLIFTRNKAHMAVNARREFVRRIVTKNEERQRLVLRTDQINDCMTRPLPGDALHVDALGQFRKRGEHSLKERAVPAIEATPRVRRIDEVGPEQEEPVTHHYVFLD